MGGVGTKFRQGDWNLSTIYQLNQQHVFSATLELNFSNYTFSFLEPTKVHKN